jgi:DNA-binding HxlR family transcriptional regulator
MLTQAQRALIDAAITTFMTSGCIPVDVYYELTDEGIDASRLLDDLADHQNLKNLGEH